MDTGRTQKQEKETTPKVTYLPDSLEALCGFTIRKAPNGSGFIFYWISFDSKGNEQLNPIEEVGESKTWLSETADKWLIDLDLLKMAKVVAKAEPKKKSNETTKVNSTTTFEIITNEISRISPDSGVVNDKAYLGVWLPAKVQEEDGMKVRQIFHLLFHDGELVPADSETLSSKDIFLHSEPIYTELKLSINTILNLADLPAIDPEQLLLDLITQVKTYVEFDDPRYYSLIAYWVIGTYFHKRFACFPYLFINALKRSGKTKLLDVTKMLAYNAVFSPNMSSSALFRLTQSAGATTLLDESEDLEDPEKKADLKSLLLSGYKRGTFVYRSEKGPNDTFVPMPFDVYSPKAIANIKGIDSVLEDRCITITMKRGKILAIINKDVPTEDPIWRTNRDRLARFYFQDYAGIETFYTQMENVENLFEGIDVVCVDSVVSVVYLRVQEKKNLYVARTWEMWRALFSIAKYIFFSYTSRKQTTQTTQTTLNPFADLLSLSVDLITEKEAENATDTGESLLIMGLLKIIVKDAYYKPQEMLDAALEFTEVLPGWFNPKWMGRVFKRLGFKEKRRYGRGVEYRLTPAQVQDIADRLNIHLPIDTQLEQWDSDFQEVWSKWLVTVRKIEECHGRNAEIPWVDPESKDYDPTIGIVQEPQELKETIKEVAVADKEKEEKPYQQLVCYWCQKPLEGMDWEGGSDFSEGKPAHIKCNADQKAQLRTRENQPAMPDFDDKEPGQ